MKNWRPVDLAAEVMSSLVKRTGIDPAMIDDVVMGCVMQVGERGLNVARNAVLAAGWPDTVPGTTVDRQCGSSRQAVHFAAQGVMADTYDVVVAAGVEVMSRVPMGSSVSDRRIVRDLGSNLPCITPMGTCAKLTTEKLYRQQLV